GVRRNHFQGLPKAVRHHRLGFDNVRMDVDDAEADVLRVAVLLEERQHVEAAVRHFEVEIIHGQVQHARVNGFKGPVAEVADEICGLAFRDDVHGVYDERELFGPDGTCRLVNLNDFGARLDQSPNLFA